MATYDITIESYGLQTLRTDLNVESLKTVQIPAFKIDLNSSDLEEGDRLNLTINTAASFTPLYYLRNAGYSSPVPLGGRFKMGTLLANDYYIEFSRSEEHSNSYGFVFHVPGKEDSTQSGYLGSYDQWVIMYPYIVQFADGLCIADITSTTRGPVESPFRFSSNNAPVSLTTIEYSEGSKQNAEAIIGGNYIDTDPFAPGGTSGPGGGGGTFDDTSDTIPFPNDPPISATDTGFMTVFATNIAGIKSLANSLWSDLFDAIKPGGSLEGTVEALKNIVASPYDAILGCSLLPFPVPVGASKNVKLYGVLPSSVTLPVASTQWVTIDCGTLTIERSTNSYLDYSPYSKVTSLYLPYIGVVSVDIDMIMSHTIGVKYKCDIISGQCVAMISVDGSQEFSYQGQCSVPIPITSIDWSSTVNAGLGILGSVTDIVGSAVGGALGGGGAAGALAGGVKQAMGEAGSVAQNVMNSKPDIKSGGGVGGSAGIMGIQTPFLIIERPNRSLPSTKGRNGKTYSQNHWTGYPSNIARRLGSLSGYTEVARVFIINTDATADEKEEIERLLYEGVYL